MSYMHYQVLSSNLVPCYQTRSENMYDEVVYLPIYDTAYGISFIFDDEEEADDRSNGNCEWPEA